MRDFLHRIAAGYRLWLMRRLGCRIGKNTEVYGWVIDRRCPHLVEIGADCILTGTCQVLAHDASTMVFDRDRRIRVGRTRILDRCFVGIGAVILPGVVVGPDAIVGANSVVTRDTGSGVVVAGCPARVICTIDEYLSKQKSPESRTSLVSANTPRGTELT